ncbi:MAG: TolC family protein [Planctomycetota bacterium]
MRRAHAEVVAAERGVALQRESIELVQRSEMLLADRFRVGEASRLDVNRVSLDRLDEQVRLADRPAALARVPRNLLELMGHADESAQWMSDGGAESEDPARWLDERDVMRLAERQRLDLVAARAMVEGRTARLELAELGRLPDVSAGVGYEQNFSNRRGVYPAISVTPKLFDDNSARVARAASELEQARIEADRVRQVAITEARQAWVALRSQQEVVQAYEGQIISLAESNLALAEAAFDAGETDLTVLLEAQRQLNRARIELIDRQLAATARLIELERATGGSLEPQPALDETLAVSEAPAPAAAREPMP